MKTLRRFLLMYFFLAFAGAFYLRWLALDFLYRRMNTFWVDSLSVFIAVLTLFTIVSALLVKFIVPVERISAKIKETGIVEDQDRKVVLSVVNKVKILLFLSSFSGTFLGQLVVMIVDIFVKKSLSYDLPRMLIILAQAALVGTICACYLFYSFDNMMSKHRMLLKIHRFKPESNFGIKTIAGKVIFTSLIAVVFTGLNCFTAAYGLITQQNLPEGANIKALYLFAGIRVGLISLLTSFGLLLVVITEINNRLNRTAKALANMTYNGTLHERIGISMNDDLSKLISNMNEFMDSFSSIIGRFRSEANEVSQSAFNLTQITKTSLTALDAINFSMGKIANEDERNTEIIQEANKNIEFLYTTAKEVENQVNAQSTAIHEGSASIHQMVTNIASVSEVSQKADDLAIALKTSSGSGSEALKAAITSIEEIQVASVEVQQTMSVIQKFASQTNLLSMNAAIEAAHAGQFGKGFAVVADEVRSLAENSSKAAKSIQNNILGMVEKINKGVKAIDAARRAFEEIDKNIEETTDIVQTITNTMDEQKVGADDTLKATASVVDSTGTIRTLATQQLTNTENTISSLTSIINTSHSISEALMEALKSVSLLDSSVREMDTYMSNTNKAIEKANQSLDFYKI